MQPEFFDRYSRLDSPVHRLAATQKLFVALALLVATVLMPIRVWVYFALVAVALMLAVAASRIPAGFLLRRLLLFEPLALSVAALSLFQAHGGRVFAAVLVKSSLCLLTMILLSNTTPFPALLRVLQRMRAPVLLITTLALMYRYLFVLVDEAERMRRARTGRTFDRNRVRIWQSLSTVVGQLFVRSTERAERTYAAMCARGWR